ncbi:hypothetical protein TKK_0004462 [Trichogramma kaykai]
MCASKYCGKFCIYTAVASINYEKNGILKRPGADKLLEHRWFESSLENPISKVRLKRYVIKKRWVKAVNTILALKRMGAHINLELV